MEAYVYQASLWCEECIEKVKADLVPPEDMDCYDSDDYPAGPYDGGGGEADSPQHCDSCGIFLENDLTVDGYRYVLDDVVEFITTGRGECIRQWIEYYDVSLKDLVDHVKERT